MALGKKGKEEEERQRLLRQVEDLKQKADSVYGKPVGTYKSWDLMTSSTGTDLRFIAPMSYSFKVELNPKAEPEYAEIKIWRKDGRVEIVRCLAGTLLINGTSVARKPNEGEAVTFNGTMKAWKFGPNGRPKP